MASKLKVSELRDLLVKFNKKSKVEGIRKLKKPDLVKEVNKRYDHAQNPRKHIFKNKREGFAVHLDKKTRKMVKKAKPKAKTKTNAQLNAEIIAKQKVKGKKKKKIKDLTNAEMLEIIQALQKIRKEQQK